ncbi:MAG: STAS domain-containing protein [Bacteroidota bacterium]|nr:STAS domain-containing protein [Bacteroidota bacterium]
MIDFSSEIHNQVLMLNLNGDLIEISLERSLIELIEASIEENILFCAIDISNLRFINSSGIGLLITILTKFRNKGGDVFLINPSDQVKKLLIITKLYAILNIVENRNEAIDQFSKL